MAKAKKKKSVGKFGCKKPVWDFYRDGVTQSFLHSYLQCREATRLAFVEGWTSTQASLPLEFGSCMHWVLSQVCGTKKPPTKLQVMKAIGAYEKVWLKENPKRTAKQLDLQENVYGLAEAVAPQYVARWESDWTKKASSSDGVAVPQKWLELEGRFKVPYWLDGEPVMLNGSFDGVFEDKKKNLWLFETKTKGRIDEAGIEDLLPLDLQVMFYCTALQLKLGRQPVGVLYNVIRRPGQRQGKEEKLNAFHERVAKEVQKPDKQDHYFIRWECRLTKKEIASWQKLTLEPMLRSVRDWWNGDAPHFMNPDALINQYGRSFMYEPLVRGNFAGHFKRSKPWNELEDV